MERGRIEARGGGGTITDHERSLGMIHHEMESQERKIRHRTKVEEGEQINQTRENTLDNGHLHRVTCNNHTR